MNKNYFCIEFLSQNMFNRILFFLSLVFFVSFSNDSIAGDAETPSAWELISEDNGIKVLERWVNNGSDVKVKERSGKMTLNCSIEEVIELIANVDKIPFWMCNVESSKRVKTVNENTWYVHTILDAPWPFDKQDMVSKYDVRRKDNLASVIIVKEDKLVPPQKDIERLDTFSAEWVIEQVKENKVKVTFTTKSTQPPKYPSWAQDPVVRKVFSSNLKNFKALINKV